MQFVRPLWACLAISCLLISAAPAQSADHARSAPLRTAWLAEFEAFAAWYAHDRQWDRENNPSVELRPFPTGRLLVDNMHAYGWNLGACGGVPALRALLRKDVYVVGVGTEEAAFNAVYARASSPLARLNGGGAARYLRGKTVLCPLGTSAHQLLLAWLDGMGLRDTDVTIVDAEPDEAVRALAKGLGEAAALWAPATYAAEELGLFRITDGRKSGIAQPVLLLAERGYADKHPERITAYLRSYLQAVESFGKMPVEELALLYQRFQREFAGKALSAANARRELETHLLFPLEKQKALLGGVEADAARPEGTLRDWLKDVIAFHKKTGALSSREAGELESLPLVTPRFLP